MRNQILMHLRKADGKFVSGEDLARKLGVSRTAIWKHMSDLKEQGYEIESQTRQGYRMISSPDRLLSEEIAHNLGTKVVGVEVHSFSTIDSTNEEAKRHIDKLVDGAVLVAESQTGGKGRLDRSFYSPTGGIYFSLILKPDFLPQEASKCTLMAAVAVAKAMRTLGYEVGIKWPNDILSKRGKKLAGILTEMSAELDRINYIVIGIGINANIHQAEFPEDLQHKASSLMEEFNQGHEISRLTLLKEVLRELDRSYLEVQAKGFSDILDEWKKLSYTLHHKVEVVESLPKNSFKGMAMDISDDGGLLVDYEGKLVEVIAGDVSIML